MGHITRSWSRPIDPPAFAGPGAIHAARSDARFSDPGQVRTSGVAAAVVTTS
jgi:hypothetical protein